MAGDWIKVQHATPDKLEIVAMATDLGLEQDAVFGKCLRLWIWADQQTTSGADLSVTAAFIDRLTDCPGFSVSLLKVGWLKSRNGRFSIPHFDRHNGQTAKNRALTKDRMKRLRYGQDVTDSSPEKRREEKRRGKEEDQNQRGGGASRFTPPSLEEVRAYCLERKNTVDPEKFIAHYTSNGWKVGRNPMKDWRAAIHSTWEKGETFGKPRASGVEHRAARRASEHPESLKL